MKYLAGYACFYLNYTQAIERLRYFSCHAETQACGLVDMTIWATGLTTDSLSSLQLE